ncbi:PREDICTED: agouti-related protein [Apaloderma vittatum]|uniref:agouti-related protein n=1 Tax=Apaloderma vittatum TaxID=57397 RepID=UPI0005216019|nr:PREDICTED: agouti-related protein [Apaloderma vittatum]
MLNALLLCCGLLQGIQVVLGTDITYSHPQKVTRGLEGMDRTRYSSMLRKVEEAAAETCIRLLESCLGQHFPCCDPCATCYCRFFNAVCYCKKMTSSSPCPKN